MKARAGSLLVELLCSSVLLGLLLTFCLAVLHSATTILNNVSERAATGETLRASRAIMSSELRALTNADIRAAARDSIAMRVFRGAGIVCAQSGGLAWLRYQGIRDPDDAKDSLLIPGEERALSFRSSSSRGSCSAQNSEQIVAVNTTQALWPGAFLLLFESGAYYLSSNALRYRRAAEGRQPLTDDRLNDAQSGLWVEPNRRGIHLLFQSLPMRNDYARASDTRVRFLNGP
jgi:hypothetical protein